MTELILGDTIDDEPTEVVRDFVEKGWRMTAGLQPYDDRLIASVKVMVQNLSDDQVAGLRVVHTHVANSSLGNDALRQQAAISARLLLQEEALKRSGIE